MSNSNFSNKNDWQKIVGLILAVLVIITFIFFVFNPPEMNSLTLPIIRFLAALVAGWSAYLFTGSFKLKGSLTSKLQMRVTGTFAAFISVFLLFNYGIQGTFTSSSPSSEIVVVHNPNTNSQVNLPTPTEKVTANYICQQLSDGTFATSARTSIGDVPLIKWTKQISSQWTPQERCQTVAERFQNYDNSGVLDYLTTGRINGENVICVADSNGDCNRRLRENGIVFTVTGNKPPSQVLLSLLDLSRYGGAPPINESAGERVYIDINKLIKTSIPQRPASNRSSHESFRNSKFLSLGEDRP
ncbi:MAG: COP23 domain-containing protein [Xenococcus sp. (in: cyanobacteria)]